MSDDGTRRCPNPACERVSPIAAEVCAGCGARLTPPVAQFVYAARPVRVPAGLLPRVDPCLPLELSGISPRHAWLDAGLVLFVTFGLPLLGSAFLAFAPSPTKEDLQQALGLPEKMLQAMTVVALAAYLLLRHRLLPGSFGIRMNSIARQLGWGALGLAICYGYLVATIFVIAPLIPFFFHDVARRTNLFEALPTDDTGYIALLLVPVVIHEELLFRGMLLPLLRRATGKWWIAILISSALFGILHLTQGVIGAAQIFGLSIVLSLIFIRSRSLWAVMIAHYAFDFFQIQLVRVLMHYLHSAQVPAP